MSFLYPLFLAGVVAIGLPILLHMIRRHTRHRVTFSSLMFLRTTMPRFRSRSRVENLPLLMLRCLVIVLLALAFARPFFARPVEESEGRLGRRLVLLVDTSASMRRDGMWAQAVDQARSALRDVDPSDRVCVMTFDRHTQTLMGFEQWEAVDPGRRVSVAVDQLSQMSPGWDRTNLGSALISAADAIEDDEVNADRQPTGPRQVVLISDVQEGSDIDALHTYDWPDGLTLAVKTVRSPESTNASLQLVANRDPLAGADDRPRVRVTNSADAAGEQFQLRWVDHTRPDEAGPAVDLYVPPGNSSIVHSPVGWALAHADETLPTQGQHGLKPILRLVLSGDDHDFDNTLYVAPHLEQQVNVLYLGNDDPHDPRDMLYFLRQALSATGAMKFRVTSQSPDIGLTDSDMEDTQIVVATDAVSQSNVALLRRYLERGHTMLLVMKSAQAAESVADLAGIGPLECTEADVNRYAMLGRLEYSHPLLAPFSDPRFGDFTRIHFWQYRKVSLADHPTARVLAWFDSNDPAWFELSVGQGTLLVFTCGWHRADSDLALSSKFVPLLHSVLEYAGVLTSRQRQYFVGDPVPLPSGFGTPESVSVYKPDDSVVHLDAAQQTFTQTDLPGIYRIRSSAGETLFAVNVAPEESLTAPMDLEELENLLNVRATPIGPALSDVAPAAGAKRVNALVQMEEQQKLWRWVLVLVLVVLLVETWLAGWLARRPETQEQ